MNGPLGLQIVELEALVDLREKHRARLTREVSEFHDPRTEAQAAKFLDSLDREIRILRQELESLRKVPALTTLHISHTGLQLAGTSRCN